MNVTSGKISSFDPEKYVYGVVLDGHGFTFASQLMTGGDRRFFVNEKVLCARYGSRWVVLGAIDLPKPVKSDLEQQTPEQALAAISGDVIQKSINDQLSLIPTFREYRETRPTASGDSLLAARFQSGGAVKSFVRAYSFGSIDIHSSPNCFIFLEHEDSEIITSARGFIQKAPGYTKTITFKNTTTSPGDVAKKLFTREELRADPLNESKERPNGTEARLDRETIEGFIPGPGGAYATGPAELFIKPQVRRGKRELLGDYLVVEHDHDTQTIRKRLDRVDRSNNIRTLEIFHAEGYLTKEGVGLAVHGSRTIFRNWGLLEFDTDVGRMLLKVHDKTVVVDKNSISLLAGSDSALHITNTGIVLKSKNIILDGKNVSVTSKNFSVEASKIAMDSDLTSITANYAIIERAWGAHLTSGAIMMNSAMQIHHNTFTLTSLAQDITSVLTDIKNVLVGVVTFNADKITPVLQKVFENFKAAVNFVHAIASDAVTAAGILSKGFVDFAVGPTGVLPGIATGITTLLTDPTVTLQNAATFAKDISKAAVKEAFETIKHTAVKGLDVGEKLLTTFGETLEELSKSLENINKAIEKVKIDIPESALNIPGLSFNPDKFGENMEKLFNSVVEIPEGVAEQIKTSAAETASAIGSSLGKVAEAAQKTAESAAGLATSAFEVGERIVDRVINGETLSFTSATFNQSIGSTSYLDPVFSASPWTDPTIMYYSGQVPPQLFGVVPQ